MAKFKDFLQENISTGPWYNQEWGDPADPHYHEMPKIYHRRESVGPKTRVVTIFDNRHREHPEAETLFGVRPHRYTWDFSVNSAFSKSDLGSMTEHDPIAIFQSTVRAAEDFLANHPETKSLHLRAFDEKDQDLEEKNKMYAAFAPRVAKRLGGRYEKVVSDYPLDQGKHKEEHIIHFDRPLKEEMEFRDGRKDGTVIVHTHTIEGHGIKVMFMKEERPDEGLHYGMHYTVALPGGADSFDRPIGGLVDPSIGAKIIRHVYSVARAFRDKYKPDTLDLSGATDDDPDVSEQKHRLNALFARQERAKQGAKLSGFGKTIIRYPKS